MRLTDITFFYIFENDPSYQIAGHSHNTYEANIMLEGNLEVTVGDTVVKLSKGDMIFWAPDITHYNRMTSNKFKFISIHFNFDTDVLDGRQSVYYHLNQNEIGIVNLFIREAQKNSNTKNGIAKISLDKNTFKDGCTAISLLESLIFLAMSGSHIPEISNKQSAKTFRNAIDYMNDNMDEFLSVPEISKKCGVSETTLKNAFKLYSGKSVKKYYTDLKIEMAKNMLINGNNVTEVAFSLGFSSSSYFSQFFKKQCHITPKEFFKQVNARKN